MSAEIRTMGTGQFATSPEMFVSLLLTRVRENDNIEGIVYAVVTKDGACDIGTSPMRICDLVYAARAMMLFADDRVRENADLGELVDPVTGAPA